MAELKKRVAWNKGLKGYGKGRYVSDETKEKIRKAKIGKQSPRKGVKLSDKTKNKIRKANKGKKLSEETKKKISEAGKGRKAWNKGKKYKSPKQSISIKGINNPNWRGGVSFELYSENWTDNLKESIRERDNYICQECGMHQDEDNKKLDIHHIDYNKYNLNPSNLITLCRSCHAKTNFNREHWFKYFNENVYE